MVEVERDLDDFDRKKIKRCPT